MNTPQHHYHERGVTSLIVVLFSTLLFVIVAVGFMQLMTAEQRASSDNELSRGAYDSALAGVEDGKRVLKACLDGDAIACAAIANSSCQTVSASGFVSETNGEVYLQSNSSSGLVGQEYEQAYTCVKIARDTKDYIGSVSDDNSVVIPLKSVGPFNAVDVSWFARNNSTSDTVALDPLIDLTKNLTTKSGWESNRPPILRVQLIQFQDGNLDFDAFDGDNGHTLYLYPKSSVSPSIAFGSDARRGGDLAPQLVTCHTTFLTTYACEANLTLPNPVGGSASDRVAYLRITPMYNNADFSVVLKDGGNVVKFHDLQPSVDSTGRAADVFRRVEARVEVDDPGIVYPRATVDVTEGFCKSFVITDSLADYQNYCD